jgi:Fe-S-cluster containining protein
LSGIPNWTGPEWNLIWEAYLGLSPTVREEVLVRVRSMGGTAPYVCPFLDLELDRCRIYEARPLVCRTYGFYVERDRGLYCREMQARAGQGEWADVVWGNQASVEAKLGEMGERQDVQRWFALQGA